MLFALALSISAIEVGGRISVDTTWTPENNPYVITSFLYVDQWATLTILPGTQIRCMGAYKENIYNFMWNGTDQPVSKMMLVYGTLVAVGTETMPISFDKYQSDSNYRWGGIIVGPNAPVPTFEYCEFRNAFCCEFTSGERSLGAIEFDNGEINIKHCLFENNLIAIRSGFLCNDIVVYDCRFVSESDTYPSPYGMTGFLSLSAPPSPVPDSFYNVTIAKCYFTGNASLGPVGYYMNILYLNNNFWNLISRDERADQFRQNYGSVSSYGNNIINGKGGIGAYSATVSDIAYARKNKLTKPLNANPINSPLVLGFGGFGTNLVSDNYLYGYVQVYTFQANATTSYIYNNVIENNYYNVLEFENLHPDYEGGQLRFYNNLLRYIGDATYAQIITTRGTSPYIYNNTFYGYPFLFSVLSDSDLLFENNIIPCTRWSSGGVSDDHHPLLINNCLAMPILPPWDMLDGGGNIVADPMYVDSYAGDFSLAEGSPCIDAGFNRPDLADFDIRYHKRVVAGIAGGTETVDIGAYEYNSVYIGGLRIYAFDAISGEAVDCVKLEIDNLLPEFSDTLGFATYHTGAGTFVVRASRWDYEDQEITDILVNEGEVQLVAIPLYRENVSNADPSLPVPRKSISIVNYPNPFNPETTLSFFLPEGGKTCLEIYNLKGQKVRTIVDGYFSSGNHKLHFNGLDDAGRALSSGIYLARISQKQSSRTLKMMLMK